MRAFSFALKGSWVQFSQRHLYAFLLAISQGCSHSSTVPWSAEGRRRYAWPELVDDPGEAGEAGETGEGKADGVAS
jgi:hypothetical protein